MILSWLGRLEMVRLRRLAYINIFADCYYFSKFRSSDLVLIYKITTKSVTIRPSRAPKDEGELQLLSRVSE